MNRWIALLLALVATVAGTVSVATWRMVVVFRSEQESAFASAEEYGRHLDLLEQQLSTNEHSLAALRNLLPELRSELHQLKQLASIHEPPSPQDLLAPIDDQSDTWSPGVVSVDDLSTEELVGLWGVKNRVFYGHEDGRISQGQYSVPLTEETRPKAEALFSAVVRQLTLINDFVDTQLELGNYHLFANHKEARAFALKEYGARYTVVRAIEDDEIAVVDTTEFKQTQGFKDREREVHRCKMQTSGYLLGPLATQIPRMTER